MNKVNHPEHYNQDKVECIEIIEQLGLNFNLGNALKYIWRCESKGKKKEDLEKAIWYLQREVGKLPIPEEYEYLDASDYDGKKLFVKARKACSEEEKAMKIRADEVYEREEALDKFKRQILRGGK